MGNTNKYIFDMDSLNEEESNDKKEARRKKHKKSRILSWVFLLVFMCILVGGLIFGATMLVKQLKPSKSPEKEVVVSSVSEEEKDDIDSIIDDILGKEDELIIAPPEPIEVEPTEEDLFDEAITEYISKMALEDKVAGIFMVTPEELTGVATVTKAGEGTKNALNEFAVGGIIYSDKNMTSPTEFKTVIDNTVSYARYPLFLAVNEECGKSVFSKAMKVEATKTPKELGSDGDATLAYLEAEKIAKYLSQYGLNLNLGVAADVTVADVESPIDARSFGQNAETCGSMAAKQIGALKEYGIGASVKCFPGEGSVALDTSNGLSVSNRTVEELNANEFVSFKAAIEGGADMIMVSHISVPSLTNDNTQCSLSKAIMTELLRKEMGLDDIIIVTDYLSKSAISSYYDSGEASITAIKAGADMVLCPENFKEAYAAVLDAVNKGVIAKERIDDSLKRIYKVKFAGKSPEEINGVETTPQE